MIPKRTTPPELVSLARLQHSVFSREQLLGLGGSVEFLRRQVREGHWHKLARGLYASTPDPDWLGWAWGGLLLAGPLSVLGGTAAGILHRLAEQPATIDVWSPVPPRVVGPWRFRRGLRNGRGEPSRISLVDAVLEMSALGEGDSAQAPVLAALQNRRVSAKSLYLRVAELPGLRNRAAILAAVESGSAGAESVLEARYLRDVERAHRLPSAVRQVAVTASTRTDAAYLDFGVLVELDGRLGHEGRGAFRDAARDNEHALEGWVTLRFGWADVTRDPCGVSRLVERALVDRGWAGTRRPCARCR